MKLNPSLSDLSFCVDLPVKINGVTHSYYLKIMQKWSKYQKCQSYYSESILKEKHKWCSLSGEKKKQTSKQKHFSLVSYRTKEKHIHTKTSQNQICGCIFTSSDTQFLDAFSVRLDAFRKGMLEVP